MDEEQQFSLIVSAIAVVDDRNEIFAFHVASEEAVVEHCLPVAQFGISEQMSV